MTPYLKFAFVDFDNDEYDVAIENASLLHEGFCAAEQQVQEVEFVVMAESFW